MSENVQSVMLEILKRIQADVSDVKGRLERLEVSHQRLEASHERLEASHQRLEASHKKLRRDSAATLVMMRGTAGVFDERMTALEEDVRLLKEVEG